MEIFPYLISVLACLLVFHWNRTNSRRKPGEPVRGLFRYPDDAPPVVATGAKRRTSSPLRTPR